MPELTTTPTEAPVAPVAPSTPEPAATPASTPAATTPATPALEPTAAPVEITAETAPGILANLSPDQRRAALFPSTGSAPAAAAPAATPATPVTPTTEATTPTTPAPAATPPTDPATTPTPGEDDDGPLPKNFRLHTEDPKLSSFLKALKVAQRSNPTVNPADVARVVGYDMPGVTPGAPDPAAVPGLGDTPPAPTGIAAVQAEIEALQTQLDAKSEELISPEYNALAAQLRGKEREMVKLEMRAEIDAEKNQTRAKTAREASKEAVLVDYPTANDDNSPLGKEIGLLYGQIQLNPTHPWRAEIGKDTFPAFLTQKAVESKTAELKSLGYTDAQATEILKKGKLTAEATGPATTVPANPPPTPPATPPVPRSVLVTAPGGNPAPTPVTMDAAQILERARHDPKFRREALGFANNYVIT